MLDKINKCIYFSFLLLLPLATAIVCIGVGRYSLTIGESLSVLVQGLSGRAGDVSPQSYSVIMNIRLPRVLLALICGSGLAIAGASLQAMLGNPMVSPDTLGVASGACFGAALALLFDGNIVVVQLSSVGFGIAAICITYGVSRGAGGRNIIMLVLSGLVVSALFQAFVSLVKYVADVDDQLPAITYWLMGSLTNITYKGLVMGGIPILLSTAVLFALRWKCNILTFGDDEARSMGVNVRAMRGVIVLASTVITASCVSMCGQVGWVGLLVPHVCRMLFCSDNAKVIPACVSLGAVFLLLIDTVARSATAAEIPISILTATMGAPFFIMLLKRTGGSWR